MVDVDTLQIVIEIVDRFSDEIRDLQTQLVELRSIAEGLDRITVDVDVRGERDLDLLQARLAALQVQEETGGVNVGGGMAGMDVPNVGGGDTADLSRTGASIGNMGAEAADSASLLQMFKLRMSDMQNVLASVIPLLIQFIGALPAVITGLVAVAAAAGAAALALGALTAIGFVGVAMDRAGGEMPSGEDFSEIFSGLLDDLFAAFAPLAEQLAPTVQGAIDNFDRFAESLAGAFSLLTELEDDFAAFGGFLEDFLTGAIENMILMADAFAPLFAMLGDFLRDFSILEELTTLMGEMLPAFLTFIGVVMDLLPVIVRMSIGFLEVSNAVLIVINAFFQLLEVLGIEQEMGVFISVILVAISVLGLLAITILSIIPAIQSLLPVIAAKISGLLGMASASFTAATAAGVLSVAVRALQAAVIGLLAATGIGLLIPILGSIAAGFLGISAGAKDAASSLKEFGRVSNRFDDGPNPFMPSQAQVGDTFTRNPNPVNIAVNIEGDADGEEVNDAMKRAQWKSKTFGGER